MGKVATLLFLGGFWFIGLFDVARAGGFDRFDQDTSLLFNSSKIVVDVSGSHLLTDRHYKSVDGRPEYVPSLDDYAVGSFKMKGQLAEDVSCMVNAGRPYGSEINYGKWSHAERATAQSLSVSELALTCAVKIPVGDQASFYAIGGLSHNKLKFDQDASIVSSSYTTLRVRSDEWNWRVGAAYRLPSAGFLVSMMYYAPIDFEFNGLIANLPLSPSLALAQIPVGGQVDFPQAVEVQARGAISPSWMLGVGFKWSDWSVFDHVPFRVSGASALPVGTEVLDLKTYFRDGLSAALFVGHQMNDRWSVLTRLGWDRAVETGWTSHSEVWSLQTTIFYKVNRATEIRLGLNSARLASGAIDQGGIHATWGTDYAFVSSAGFILRLD